MALIREKLVWWAIAEYEGSVTARVSPENYEDALNLSGGIHQVTSSTGIDIKASGTYICSLKQSEPDGSFLISGTASVSGNATIEGNGKTFTDTWTSRPLELGEPYTALNVIYDDDMLAMGGVDRLVGGAMPCHYQRRCSGPLCEDDDDQDSDTSFDDYTGPLTATTLPDVPGPVSTTHKDEYGATWNVALTPTKWRPALVRVWLNVFIGSADPGTEPMPDHPGQTWIQNPVPYEVPGTTDVVYYFGTDERGFSQQESASSRVHAAFTLWMGLAQYDYDSTRLAGAWDSQLLDVVLSTSGTLGYDETGNVVLNGKSDLSRCKISNLRWADGSGGGIYQVDVNIQASDPLVPAPDVDLKGTIKFDLSDPDNSVNVSFAGLADPWPSFEMYAQVIDFAGQPIIGVFQQAPKPGTGPASLIGNPTTELKGSATLTSTGP